MATKPNITKLYDKIFSLKEMLSEIVNTAMEAANESEAFGGEVSRVITGQLRAGLIPTIKQYVDDTANEASMQSLISFLDTVPLAWVRSGPEQVPAYTPASAEATIPTETEIPAAEVPTGELNPTAPAPTQVLGESSILRSNLREQWAEEHKELKEEMDLDFKRITKNFNPRKIPTSLSVVNENKVYDNLVNKTKKRLKEDMIFGPSASGPIEIKDQITEKVDLNDWKTLLSDTALEENLKRN